MRSAVATIPEGLLPAHVVFENARPVGTNATTFGDAGVDTSITQTEFASRALGSPRPGTRTVPRPVSRSAPLTASALGNPNAGNGSPVSRACFGSARGIARDSNIPLLVAESGGWA